MKDIKILDWIGVFNPRTLGIDINEVCDIFSNNKGEKMNKQQNGIKLSFLGGVGEIGKNLMLIMIL